MITALQQGPSTLCGMPVRASEMLGAAVLGGAAQGLRGSRLCAKQVLLRAHDGWAVAWPGPMPLHTSTRPFAGGACLSPGQREECRRQLSHRDAPGERCAMGAEHARPMPSSAHFAATLSKGLEGRLWKVLERKLSISPWADDQDALVLRT